MTTGPGELLIVLVVILLIFGPSKLPALARSLGQAQHELRKGIQEGAGKPAKPASSPSPPRQRSAEAQRSAEPTDDIKDDAKDEAATRGDGAASTTGDT